MPVLEGQSQIDLFSTRGHHSTWEPIQAASHGSDCAERLLAEENICCHADIHAIYSMRDGSKKVWMCLRRRIMKKGGWIGCDHILGRGICGCTITLYGFSSASSYTCFS